MTIMQGFQKQQFLREYWQKKPCVIREFAKHFVDPIDEHELAGLAQEPDVDSRLISNVGGKWQLTQGPIEDFSELCVGAWTLLVQGVDKYVEQVHALSGLVDFIPNWRFEDVMVSFSNPQAGVGPHTDEYDVIIVQGKGRRRWQIGLPNTLEQHLPHPLLKQVSGFLPLIDEELMTGDAVYIPPKHPHNGVALSECMNYSIGFRAPTNVELLAGVVDESACLLRQQSRYSDPDLYKLREQSMQSCQVSHAEIEELKTSLKSLIDSENVSQAITQFLSRQSLPDLAMDEAYTLQETLDLLKSEGDLIRAPGVRPLYFDGSDPGFIFYVDGQDFHVPDSIEIFTEAFIQAPSIRVPLELEKIQLQAFAPLCLSLLNAGYWSFQEK